MRSCSLLASLAAVLLSAAPAWSHFVWVAVEKNSAGQPAAHVWFSELAEPDNPDLLDRITNVKVWSRSAGTAEQVSALKKVDHGGGGGALIGSLSKDSNALSAHINYGVLTRREQTFLLHYHAKYLNAAAKDLKALARDEKLEFDVVPQASAGGYTLEVLFRGKPAAAAEVVILDPAGDEKETKADAQGRVSLASVKPGLYSIRAKWTVMEAGKVGDKEYPSVNHYCTLALRVPNAPAVGAAGPGAAGLTAADMINKARDTRAVWNNFKGFDADLTLFTEGRQQQGRINVTAEGQVTLHGFELKDEKALLGTLRSLVSHRLAASEADDRASFADGDLQHPLGRLIRLDGDAMASAYRIKDDVIREVNREMDGGRFTISVFEVNRNPEGKYLPGYYTVSYWNKDGSLRSSSVIRESWTRVGHLDLPTKYDAVFTGASDHRNVSMQFSNFKLGK